MLQTIRDKITGWFAYLFLGAIAVVFIFWGVQMRTATGSNYAAKVNGDRISLEIVNRAWQERQQRLQQMMRGEIPEAMRKAQQEAVLNEHIRKQLLSQLTDDLGYRASNEQLRETINSFPELQVDGKFSRERYAMLLRQQGRSEPQFERELQASLKIEQLQNGIAASSFVTPAELQRRQALEGEQREVDYALVPASGFLASVTVNDADIQSFYDANKPEFMTVETVDLEYIELLLADVEKDVAVTDDMLHEYYEQVKGVDDATAKAKAEEVLGKLKAGGDFAALAKQYSQDAVSAAKGGDLGWASRGMFVGPFEDALFAMSPGELRGPVKTQFGYHIIKLEAAEGGQVKSFEEARAELTREFKAEKAQALFYDRSQKMGDEAFNALSELDTPAKDLGLTVQKIAGMSRQGGAPGTLSGNPKVIDAAFAQEAIDKRQNSPLIQVADDRAVVLRVAEHHPPEQKPLSVVRLEVETKLKQRAAHDAAAKRGAEMLARMEAGGDWTKTLGEFKLTPVGKKSLTRTDSSLPPAVRQNVFALPRTAVTAEKPAFRGATVENGDYALIRVSAISPGKLETGSPEATAKRQQTAQALGSEEFGAYLADAESRAKIERNPKVFE
jgi:peptidyl-prolyl cis-trans isomerase D